MAGYMARLCADRAVFEDGFFDPRKAVETLFEEALKYCASTDRPFEVRVAEQSKQVRDRLMPYSGPLPWRRRPKATGTDGGGASASEGSDVE